MAHDAVIPSAVAEWPEVEIESLLRQAEDRVEQQTIAALHHRHYVPKLKIANLTQPYIQTDSHIARMDGRRMLDQKIRSSANKIKKIVDPVELKQKSIEEKKATAGANWFNLPKTNLTPELKRDLQLIKLRSVLDPHRHYKKDSGKGKIPEFSEVGTVVEGPTEFYSARLRNADRKRTLVEDVLAKEKESGRFKSKYNDIQVAKMSGRKGHYKAQMAKKYGRNRVRSKYTT